MPTKKKNATNSIPLELKGRIILWSHLEHKPNNNVRYLYIILFEADAGLPTYDSTGVTVPVVFISVVHTSDLQWIFVNWGRVGYMTRDAKCLMYMGKRPTACILLIGLFLVQVHVYKIYMNKTIHIEVINDRCPAPIP